MVLRFSTVKPQTVEDIQIPLDRLPINVKTTKSLSSRTTITTISDVSLDYLGRFKDPHLQQEFILSCLDQKSTVPFLILTFLLLGWAIAETIARSWFLREGPMYLNELYGILGLVLAFFSMIGCIILSVCPKLQNDHSRKILSNLQVIFIILINCIFLFKIYILIDTNLCIPTELNLLSTLQEVFTATGVSEFTTIVVEEELGPYICPASTSFSSICASQTVLMMGLAPQPLMAIIYEPRLYLLLIFLLCTGGLMIYVTFSALYSILPLLFMLLVLFVTFRELHYQRVNSFLNHRKLQEILRENERTADAVHAMEMRHMIGNVAHDLKTPLASFSTGLDLIKEIVQSLQIKVSRQDKASFQECCTSLNSCLASIRNINAFMLMTINRCIDYTKASKGMMLVPKYETVDLREALQFPIECMSNIQERIGIKLEPLSEEICRHTITDKQWLQENLLCLLSNAVKYSAEGYVTISAFLTNRKPSSSDLVDFPVMSSSSGSTNANYNSSTDCIWDGKEHMHYLHFEIEDSGIGLSEEAMKNLFNPFKQAQRLAGGTGLGLFSLAKRVEALKGSYGVRGRTDGKQGSLFWFAIPYRPDRTAEIAPSHSSDTARDNLAKLHPFLVAAETKLLEKLEILIIDDSPSILKMSSMLLKRQGHQIWTAENGEIALKKIEEKWKESGRGFDLVLMDLQMPVMDGLEATRRLRKMESEGRDWMAFSSHFFPYSRHVIVGVSANSDHDTMKEALNAGMNEFLGKPFSVELFQCTVQRCLQTSVCNTFE